MNARQAAKYYKKKYEYLKQRIHDDIKSMPYVETVKAEGYVKGYDVYTDKSGLGVPVAALEDLACKLGRLILRDYANIDFTQDIMGRDWRSRAWAKVEKPERKLDMFRLWDGMIPHKNDVIFIAKEKKHDEN